MHFRWAAAFSLSALVGIACGGGGSSGGTVAAPTAPSAPNAAAPAVNVGGNGPTALPWAGQASDDQGGSGTVGLTLQQTGALVTGSIYVQALAHSGPFTGTVSGNVLSFNFSVGNSGNGCGNAISGMATVSSVNMMTAPPNTMNTMTATFSGKDCSGGPVTNGTFTASLQDPSIQDQTASATRFPIAGTWTAFLPPPLGGGSWTWALVQNGDVNGGTLTGSVTVSPDNTLNLGTGIVTGTFTNIFPGPPNNVSAVTNVSFTGACPTMLTANWGNLPQVGPPPGSSTQWGATGFVSGSICNGPLPAFKPALKRQ
jgi:hypothetical protein